MAWYFFEFLIGILAIIGVAAILCAVITFVLLARSGDVPDDERHREEDEEQLEWIRKWREENERKQILESDDVRRKKR